MWFYFIFLRETNLKNKFKNNNYKFSKKKQCLIFGQLKELLNFTCQLQELLFGTFTHNQYMALSRTSTL
jgi:hypothetical protein